LRRPRVADTIGSSKRRASRLEDPHDQIHGRTRDTLVINRRNVIALDAVLSGRVARSTSRLAVSDTDAVKQREGA